MRELKWYGKSMYDGWYIVYFENGAYDGFHANTLKDLCAKLGVTKRDLAKVTRYDN